MNTSEKNPFYLLMVDDSEPDIDLFKMVMRKANMHVELAVVYDGESLLRYLKKEPPYEQAITPDLILLDINMPGMNGIEALKIVKNDNRFKTIPILMLTSSDREEDVVTCYKEHANSYIVKPLQIADFVKIISAINYFWVSSARRPSITHYKERTV